MSLRDGKYKLEDLIDYLNEARSIILTYKEHKNDPNITYVDIISFREDLSIVRAILGDIETDMFEDKLACELEYDNFILTRTEQLEQELSAQMLNGKKVPYAEDKAKRRAKIEGYDRLVQLNKAKSNQRRAYVFVQHTLEEVLHSMSSRINLLRTPAQQVQGVVSRPVHDDPFAKYWGKDDDSSLDDAIDDIDRLENELD